MWGGDGCGPRLFQRCWRRGRGLQQDRRRLRVGCFCIRLSMVNPQRARGSGVKIDGVGNVIGTTPASDLPPESTGPVVVMSAHLDTVFPAETVLNPVVEGDRLTAPGACDNGAGVIGMLAIAHALIQA